MNRPRSVSLEEHRTRMDQVWKDFDAYQKILSDLKRRVEALEEPEGAIKEGST